MPDSRACNEQPVQKSANGPQGSSVNVLDEQITEFASEPAR